MPFLTKIILGLFIVKRASKVVSSFFMYQSICNLGETDIILLKVFFILSPNGKLSKYR